MGRDLQLTGGKGPGFIKALKAYSRFHGGVIIRTSDFNAAESPVKMLWFPRRTGILAFSLLGDRVFAYNYT